MRATFRAPGIWGKKIKVEDETRIRIDLTSYDLEPFRN